MREIYKDGTRPRAIAKLFNVNPGFVHQVIDPEKLGARRAAKYEVMAGRLVKAKRCENCNRRANLSMHHPDYSRPLLIQWLCLSCHRHADIERRSSERNGMRSCKISINISKGLKHELETVGRRFNKSLEEIIYSALTQYAVERAKI
jgi:hypothetical protein